MGKLKGIQVILVEKIQVGKDPFNNLIYENKEVTIENVLVAPTLSDDIINQLNLTGKKAVYTLAIPKDDDHVWEDKEVIFFGKRWRVFGEVLQGVDDLIPLGWNKKVMVERYG